ncbi:MAG TPA: WD40 repeat domain-containing protein, partial [Verrucomicrobiales bacterium]|nr:WD40 repeat domain-containing protein [Verrucomicrobiales bacterium]
IEIRDAGTNAVVRTLAGLPAKVNAVHFTADGTQLILAGGITGLHGVAQLRSVADGSLIREFSGHSDVLYDAEISPDGHTLATAGYDRTIRLWQLSDAKLLRTIDVHKGAVFALAWHPDGKVLASASADETVKLWRVSDGVRLDTLNQPQGEMSSVLFTPDGQYVIAAGGDKRIHLWRFISKDAPALNPVVHSRFAHESAVCGIALSADGKHLLSSADDRSLKLWTVPDLTLERACETQPDIAPVLLAAPQPDKFLAARMDGSTAMIQAGAAVISQAPAPAPSAAAPATHAAGTTAAEIEPNNEPGQAMPVQIPASITGAVSAAGDADLFRFHAAAGEELTLEVNAARSKSKLDSRLEILRTDGTPVEQVVLQATRDSWFTFRGKDSDTSDDFRLHNWAEMELNEYLYANGEVVKLWLYPRGPDSGYKVYPGSGKRHTCFGTPALVHALGAPAYVVTPLPPGSQPPPNGLPVFHLNYENDDDSFRRLGLDSLLLFTAPADGDYVVRLTDVRGFGGAKGYGYTLAIRPRQRDFKASTGGGGPKVSPGSGREITFSVERTEGFDGPVRIDAANLPPGFTLSTPVEIEAGQTSAIAVLSAAPDAVNPDAGADKAVKITATARIDGKEITKDLGTLGDIQLGPAPKVAIGILPDNGQADIKEVPGQPMELTIHPGQTITARVRASRNDFTGRIELGGDDSGRNLPHGLYVDNIGLNGLLIVEGQTERTFFITASKIAKPCTRLFHLRATADGGQASRPVLIRVVPAK